jgi:uncharacterized protein YecT (DUF1311 family)
LSPDDYRCTPVPASPPSALYPPVEECAGDDRGYTLCAAEMAFEQADLELNRQWAVTLAHVLASAGERGAERLRDEQRQWVSDRDRECEALAADSPSTQSGRNQTSCMALLTEERTVELKIRAGQQPGLVAAEIIDPARMEERTADFRRSMVESGNSGYLADCRKIMDVTQGRVDSNHSYGAVCTMKSADTLRDVFVCNDEMVGHFAIAPATDASRDAVVAFVKSNCVGG